MNCSNNYFKEYLNPFSYINRSLSEHCFSSEQFNRLTSLALPVLNLYQPAALPISIGGGILQLKGHVDQIQSQWHQNQSISFECLKLAVTMASIAGSIFQWRTGLILTASYEVAQDIQQLAIKIFNQRPKQEITAQLLTTCRHAIHLASVAMPTPHLMAISLLSQVIFEGYNILAEWKEKGLTAESLVNLLLCAVHVYQFQQHAETIYDHYMLNMEGQALSDVQMQELMDDIHVYKSKHPNVPLNFASFLKERQYSTHLVNANFTQAIGNRYTKDLLSNIDFRHICFTNAQFEGLHLSQSHFYNCKFVNFNFQKSHLSQITFNKCQFNHFNAKSSIFNNVIFKDSSLKEGDFYLCEALHLTFSHTKLDRVNLREAILDRLQSYNTIWTSCCFDEASCVHGQFTHSQFHHISADYALWTKTQWTHCVFKHSRLTSAIFKQAELSSVSFEDSNLSDTSFNSAHLQHITCQDSTLNYANFEHAQITDLKAQNCPFLGTSFLDAKVTRSCLSSCDLTDTLFFAAKPGFRFYKCTENIMTRPVIGLPWNVESPGFTIPMVYDSIKVLKGIPLRLDYLLDNIDLELLEQEVNTQIDSITRNFKPEEIISIPDQLLEWVTPDSQIGRIQAKAAYYINKVDALVLGGGMDLRPDYYREQSHPNTMPDANECRTLFEFSAAKEAIKKGDMTVVGICRNCQLLNVLLGGSLEQDLEGQWSQTQSYKVEPGAIQNLVGPTLTGISMHHQGITPSRLAKGLKPSIIYDGIVKAWEWPGRNIFGFQFHPEWGTANMNLAISPENATLMDKVIHDAAWYCNKYKKDEQRLHPSIFQFDAINTAAAAA